MNAFRPADSALAQVGRTTRAPARASPRAKTRPSPRLEPVTKAIFPLTSNIAASTARTLTRLPGKVKCTAACGSGGGRRGRRAFQAFSAGTNFIDSEFTQWRVFFAVKPSPRNT